MRNVTIILAASGWGAGKFGAADGAMNVSQKQLLNNLLNDHRIQADVYFANWHFNSCQNSQDHPIQKRRNHVLQVGRWIHNIAERAIHQGNFLLVIGGDHSIAMGTWSGVKDAGVEFGLLWIDAHMDAHTYETTVSNNPHGMPAAVLLGRGDRDFVRLTQNPPVLNPNALIQTGIRSYEIEEEMLLKHLGVEIGYHKKREAYNGCENFLRGRELLLKSNPFFGISLDIDGIDPTYCPGTGTPEGGGLELHDVTEFLKGIIYDPKCIGLEIVEYNPILDQDNFTFEAMKKMIDIIKT